MTWDFIKRLRDTTKMKIVLKGILAYEDAVLAADAGIDAHHRVEPRRPQRGFRPLDHRRAAGDRRGGQRPHADLVDSGFRRGTDIVKALCMGATAVCVGRPYIWGLGAFGQPGVERVLELMRVELYGSDAAGRRADHQASHARHGAQGVIVRVGRAGHDAQGLDGRLFCIQPDRHRRRRAPRRNHDAARPRADAGLHAGRHPGDREGPHAGGGGRDRRRDRARQHLSSDAAAGRRAHRRARRPAQIHELAAADPDRFRRLPGDVAVAAAQARRAGRHLPLASRRRDASSCRPSARSRSRRCSAPTSPCNSTNACRLPAPREEIERAMQLSLRWARAQQTRLRGPRARGLRVVRHRAGRRRYRVARSRARERSTDIGFHGYAIGGLAVGEPQDVMLKIVEETTPVLPADRAALPDGRRHAATICSKRWRAASTCSTA